MIITSGDSHKARIGCGDCGLSVAVAAEAHQGGVRLEATGMKITSGDSHKARIGCGDCGLSEVV